MEIFKISYMKPIIDLFNEALELEDNLLALSGGCYDTHDLESIEENKKSYEDRLAELKLLFNIKNDEYFCNLIFEDLKLIKN